MFVDVSDAVVAPDVQGMHSFEPVALAYVPRGHDRHEASFSAAGVGPNVPSGHRVQIASEEAPRTAEYVPAGQSAQTRPSPPPSTA